MFVPVKQGSPPPPLQQSTPHLSSSPPPPQKNTPQAYDPTLAMCMSSLVRALVSSNKGVSQAPPPLLAQWCFNNPLLLSTTA